MNSNENIKFNIIVTTYNGVVYRFSLSRCLDVFSNSYYSLQIFIPLTYWEILKA